ncbi:MAG TPA: quinone oxidoreductase [Acidimicrobiia bacterium]|nr:quinone oxidoreductase [Acidimicrobiia bacterium]
MLAIQVDETGGPEVLQAVELSDPEPAPGRLVVEVEAAGLNFIDVYQRSGLYPMELPFVPGLEGAGHIQAIGEGVTGVEVGDVVAWADSPGSYAGMISLPAERAVPVPAEIEPSTAAAVMLQGLTAHYLATSTFPLQAGHRCLIHAGAGGVGRLLIQIAKRVGAVVFTTVGSAEKEQVAAAAGADHVINYREVPFAEAITAIAGERPLDVVYDGVGASTFEGGLSLLKTRGMMVTFGNASGPVPPVSPLTLMRNGSIFLTRPTLGDHVATTTELRDRSRELFEWIADGSLEVLVGETYPLAETNEAHRALEGRVTVGKVLIVP